MSLPDYLLDDHDVFCDECGVEIAYYGRLCWACKQDNIDLYADMQIQDEKEGK